MKKNIIVVMSFVAVALVSSYFYWEFDREKSAFVFNEQVFNAFKGKIELEKKIKSMEEANAKVLDSLLKLPMNERNILLYEEEKQRFALTVQHLSGKYTADVWERINEYVSAYGEEHGYDYIFGASGDGSLMYARNDNDVTVDVIAYINRKYEGND